MSPRTEERPADCGDDGGGGGADKMSGYRLRSGRLGCRVSAGFVAEDRLTRDLDPDDLPVRAMAFDIDVDRLITTP